MFLLIIDVDFLAFTRSAHSLSLSPPVPFQVHLSWYGDIPYNMAVTWTTLNDTATSTVMWGLSPQSLTNTAGGDQVCFLSSLSSLVLLLSPLLIPLIGLPCCYSVDLYEGRLVGCLALGCDDQLAALHQILLSGQRFSSLSCFRSFPLIRFSFSPS
jgi:hypothetical protein